MDGLGAILAQLDDVHDTDELVAMIERVSYDLADLFSPSIADTENLALIYRVALLERAVALITCERN